MNKKRKTLLIFAALLILIPTLFMVIRCQRRNFQEEEAETVRTVKYAAPKAQVATASYLVEHYLQNIQKNGYEKNDSETLYGQPGALTQATAWVFPGFTTKAFQQKAIREDNSTVIAIYYDRQEIRYTIDLAGGSLPGEKQRFTITGTYGKKVALPLPQKKGYLFSSWNPELPATFGEGDYTDFSATYTREGEYAIHYELSGGENTAQNPASYNVETATITLAPPTRKGYTFTGWTSGENNEVPITQIPRGSTGQLRLRAHWLPNEFTVSFNAGGGLCDAQPIRVTYNQSYGSLPRAEREGYDFAGWTLEDGRETTAETRVTTREDHVLHAKWLPKHYTVTFSPNGGEGTMAAFTDCLYGTAPRLPSHTFSRRGYTFRGWTERPRLKGNQLYQENAAYPITGDSTLYAQWQPNSYTVRYEGNGGTGSMDEQRFFYDTLQSLKNNGYTRGGWDFAGWSKSPDAAEAEYKVPGQVKNLAEQGSVTLYAVWRQPSVIFDAAGGSIQTDRQQMAYKIPMRLRSSKALGLKKEGYSFMGWAAGKSRTTVTYEDETEISIANDTLLTAVWKANNYTVSFSTEKNTVIEKREITYGSTYGSLPLPQKEGYTFGGWFSDSACSEERRVTALSEMDHAQNSTLYACWHKNPIITFKANGGTLSQDRQTVGYNSPSRLAGIEALGVQAGKKPGAAVPIPDFVYISGGSFGGWSTKADGSGAFYADEGSVTFTEDTVLYAQWRGYLWAASPGAQGQGSVITRPFYLCSHEVTQAEYEAYCMYGGNEPGSQYGLGADIPAYYISWYDAIAYCNLRSLAEGLEPVYSIEGRTNPRQWKGASFIDNRCKTPAIRNAQWDAVTADFSKNGYRLPTEAEWQYAALSGYSGKGWNGYDDKVFSGYDGSNSPEDYVWYNGNSDNRAQAVKRKKPNSSGLYDMSGNVWEWCWDIFAPYPRESSLDYKGPAASGENNAHVLKGGSWSGTPAGCSVSRRISAQAQSQYYYYGFRLARSSH